MEKIKLTEHDKRELLKIVKLTNKKNRTSPYQAIGDLKGTRKTEFRYKFMNLPEDFEGKSVLDIGCNLGAMSYMAKQRGAGRVVGIDYNTTLLETSSSIFKRHNYDISLIGYDLNTQGFEPLVKILREEKFDYIFALSIYHHVDDKKVLWNIINNYCSDICWFEGHKRNTKEELEKELLSNLHAKKIEFIGNIKDHVRRSIFKCVF
jgi:2-polyprenyl-3-methyl-5-hydroxy-6-metoxy-1,4-benzoquinol methylase